MDAPVDVSLEKAKAFDHIVEICGCEDDPFATWETVELWKHQASMSEAYEAQVRALEASKRMRFEAQDALAGRPVVQGLCGAIRGLLEALKAEDHRAGVRMIGAVEEAKAALRQAALNASQG